MNYQEAKELMNKHINDVPKQVSLFIAPQGEAQNLWWRTDEDDNKKALEEIGFMDKDSLDVYAAFKEDNRVYYPTLEYFLAIQKLRD